VRELADESDRVGQNDASSVGELELASRRIERREEPVLDDDTGAGEPVEGRRLARVRVADQRDNGYRRLAELPRHLTVAAMLDQVGANLLEAALDPAPVDLEL